jgi:hypothetical protein
VPEPPKDLPPVPIPSVTCYRYTPPPPTFVKIQPPEPIFYRQVPLPPQELPPPPPPSPLVFYKATPREPQVGPTTPIPGVSFYRAYALPGCDPARAPDLTPRGCDAPRH